MRNRNEKLVYLIDKFSVDGIEVEAIKLYGDFCYLFRSVYINGGLKLYRYNEMIHCINTFTGVIIGLKDNNRLRSWVISTNRNFKLEQLIS